MFPKNIVPDLMLVFLDGGCGTVPDLEKHKTLPFCVSIWVIDRDIHRHIHFENVPDKKGQIYIDTKSSSGRRSLRRPFDA